MEALGASKVSEITNLLGSMNSEQHDLLMKYIYKGMAFPTVYNSAVLLAWHEKVSTTTCGKPIQSNNIW
jgi:actin related protein 2/3 complex subunit 5